MTWSQAALPSWSSAQLISSFHHQPFFSHFPSYPAALCLDPWAHPILDYAVKAPFVQPPTQPSLPLLFLNLNISTFQAVNRAIHLRVPDLQNHRGRHIWLRASCLTWWSDDDRPAPVLKCVSHITTLTPHVNKVNTGILIPLSQSGGAGLCRPRDLSSQPARKWQRWGQTQAAWLGACAAHLHPKLPFSVFVWCLFLSVLSFVYLLCNYFRASTGFNRKCNYCNHDCNEGRLLSFLPLASRKASKARGGPPPSSGRFPSEDMGDNPKRGGSIQTLGIAVLSPSSPPPPLFCSLSIALLL